MNRLKLLSIIGARPQFIKYSAISRSINKHNKAYSNSIQEIIVHTGQHYDYLLSKVFFDELAIPTPDYNLEVGSGKQGQQTAKILEKIEEVLIQEIPDWVIIFGDTNSTLAGALAATKLHLPLIHIEAGLRSYNNFMPEEINRIISDKISNLLFCPSQVAVNNLIKEGIKQVKDIQYTPNTIKNYLENKKRRFDLNEQIIFNSGDIMFDSINYALSKKSNLDLLKEFNVSPKNYLLCTIHRAKNTNDLNIFNSLIKFVTKLAQNRTVLMPLHPRTKDFINTNKIILPKNITTISPLGYFDLITILNNSSLVLTDSGGMQKEAYWLKTPCITLREETEWVETIESGWNVLYKDYQLSLGHQFKYYKSFYGEGYSAKKIIDAIILTSFPKCKDKCLQSE